ncbi:matrix Gla protein [Brienomyrus brachyistius]|uniref:matrix Gla protein n=1 Tax=Brienomyrus brachyistius TaxID=42636 RepID=UPI0020B3CE09|nr:matrix Gla protein [Brienomyrus brachyistius]XP_048847510.1 matrix Gla protein [Brienomyrus brachyistius]
MMKTILQCVFLAALVTLCLCYDSHESQESLEDPFVTRYRANSFFNTRRGPIYNNHNYRRLVKSPAERRAEVCEDFSPCRLYANRHGSHVAYQRFFASRNPWNRRY